MKLSEKGWYVVLAGKPFKSDDDEFVHFIQAGRFAFDVTTPVEVGHEEAVKLATLLSAAPELLEALEWMLVDGTPAHKCGGHGGSSCACNCATEKAKAAVAKARGL